MQAAVWMMVCRRVLAGWACASTVWIAPHSWAGSTPADPSAAERGRVALLQHSYLKAEWRIEAYRNAGKLWSNPAPDPDKDPDGYARAFAALLWAAPCPLSQRRAAHGPALVKEGRTERRPDIQVDCMACHGGSIGGKSYVGLPNTQVDYDLLFTDLFRADGRRVPLVPFTISSARGTTNAGMMAVVLLSVRNPDLSRRQFPCPWAPIFPSSTPRRGGTSSTRRRCITTAAPRPPRSGRTCSSCWVRRPLSNSKALEPTFRDIQAYLLSLEPPKYPFPIDDARAERGKVVFEKTCARCHGTYGANASYPSKIVPLDVIGTDPARSLGISDRAVEHYNATWFGKPTP